MKNETIAIIADTIFARMKEPHTDADVRLLAAYERVWRPIFDTIEPGNGSRYEVMACHAPQGSWSGIQEEGGIFVAWRGHGAAMLAPDGILASSYVREKLGGSECDASAIVLWICTHFPNREALTFCECEAHLSRAR